MNFEFPSFVGKDLLDTHAALARAVVAASLEAVAERGVFHLALSGGSTPEKFYFLLVTDPRFRALPWMQTHLWIVDERRVSFEDDRSNFKMIREMVADHIPTRKRLIHPMPVMESDPAALYEQELREQFKPLAASRNPTATSAPRLDFILLGMGDDAHTASLFPHSPALKITDQLIAINAGPTVTPPGRVTMTYPLLNAARNLAVLVTGAKKTATLRRVSEQLKTGPDLDNLPITGIGPINGDLTWYLDAEAAG